MRPLLEDCAAVPCSMEPLLGPLVARASAGVFLPSPFSYRGGAHACALPWEELCCSDQQRGTVFGHLLASPGIVSYESPSIQWATQLVLSGPVKFLVRRDLREMRIALRRLSRPFASRIGDDCDTWGVMMMTKKSVRGILVAGEFPNGNDCGSACRSQSAIEVQFQVLF
jgi:hypothetical protein